jgi:hypothetical protein
MKIQNEKREKKPTMLEFINSNEEPNAVMMISHPLVIETIFFPGKYNAITLETEYYRWSTKQVDTILNWIGQVPELGFEVFDTVENASKYSDPVYAPMINYHPDGVQLQFSNQLSKEHGSYGKVCDRRIFEWGIRFNVEPSFGGQILIVETPKNPPKNRTK